MAKGHDVATTMQASKDQSKDHSTTHGGSYTRLYNIWTHMKSRCLSPTNKAYPYYGGRGVCVCQEWIDSYETFRDWAIGNGYSDGLELDRTNVNGNYEPGNCRWATRHQQMQNTRKRRNAKTSVFKGVSIRSRTGRWVVQLHANGKPVYIGSYKTQLEAAFKYDDAARERYGEFAHVNFPERKAKPLGFQGRKAGALCYVSAENVARKS